MHLAYILILSHLSAKNYRNLWKFDKVLTKTNLLSFFGTWCIHNYRNCNSFLCKKTQRNQHKQMQTAREATHIALPFRTCTISCMSVVSSLIWLNEATVAIGTNWSESICDTRYASTAKFSLIFPKKKQHKHKMHCSKIPADAVYTGITPHH